MTVELLRLLDRATPGLQVETGAGRIAQYAYDASNYRVPPLAVAFPRAADDVRAVLQACRELGIPVTARGGGTSMAGNAVGPGVVLDFSRHMNRVLSIDPEALTAHVEAGVVLDDLRAEAADFGLTFGPDPSSHSRCTLGGMIGNDACGNRSVRFADLSLRPRLAGLNDRSGSCRGRRLQLRDAGGSSRGRPWNQGPASCRAARPGRSVRGPP
jgi:FAD/FMN-containing dehydrogenase